MGEWAKSTDEASTLQGAPDPFSPRSGWTELFLPLHCMPARNPGTRRGAGRCPDLFLILDGLWSAHVLYLRILEALP